MKSTSPRPQTFVKVWTDCAARKGIFAGIFALCLAGAVVPVRAEILVYEPFAEPLQDGASLNGIRATGTGISGEYSAKTTINATGDGAASGSAVFTSEGLELGENFHPVTGGAAVVTAASSTAEHGHPAKQLLSVPISAASQGAVYCSYLMSFASAFSLQNSGYTSVKLTLGDFATALNLCKDFENVAGVGFKEPRPGKESIALSDHMSYLAVARFEAGGTGESKASLWVFDGEGYAEWIKNGAKEEHLASYALYFADSVSKPGEVFSLTGPLKVEVSSGNISGTVVAVTVDEIVAGTALADVTTGTKQSAP
jgi:hypothetical protein